MAVIIITMITIISSKDKQSTSPLQLRQKVKQQDKLAALYRHLNVTGDLDLIDLDQFDFIKDTKKAPLIYFT